MQFLSHNAILGDAIDFPAHPQLQEFLQREEVRHLASIFVVLIVCSQIVHILSLWMSSKMLVHPDGSTLINALKVWGFNLLVWVAVVVVAGLISTVNGLADDHTRVLIILGGTAMASLLMVFLIPMKVYVIGFIRALGVLLITACLASVVMFGLEIAAFVGFRLDKQLAALQASFGKTPEEQKAFLARLAGHEAPDEIDRLLDDALRPIGPKPSLAEREAMVATLQQKLKARQNKFPRGRPPPPEFQAQLNRYLQFLNEVLAERKAASESPQPAH